MRWVMSMLMLVHVCPQNKATHHLLAHWVANRDVDTKNGQLFHFWKNASNFARVKRCFRRGFPLTIGFLLSFKFTWTASSSHTEPNKFQLYSHFNQIVVELFGHITRFFTSFYDCHLVAPHALRSSSFLTNFDSHWERFEVTAKELIQCEFLYHT